MENATKTLLIIAAVLIVIVLVTLGVLLLGNTSDTSEQAHKVGNSIGLATNNALDSFLGIKRVSAQELRNWANSFGYSQVAGLNLSDEVIVNGYFFQGYCERPLGVEGTAKWWYGGETIQWPHSYEEIVNEWIPSNEGKIKKLKNPMSKDEMKNEFMTIALKYDKKVQNRP